MVYSKPLNILVVLVLLSFAKGFSLAGNWVLSKATAGTIGTSISNLEHSGTPSISSDAGTNLDSLVGRNSISLNSQTWSLGADASSLISATEYAFGFWVIFESTISTQIFQFGNDNSNHYIVSSTENGTLKVSFFSDATPTNSANDFSLTVPLSNFYTDKWFFLVVHFTNVSGTPTLEIILKFPKLLLLSRCLVGNFFSEVELRESS